MQQDRMATTASLARLRFRAGLFSACATLSLSAAAHAATYTYTGDDFNSFSLPSAYTAADKVTGSITLTSALADNLTSFVSVPAASITSFSFSDGLQTISNANATGSAFAFKTDATGKITAWQVTVLIGSVASDSIATVDFPGVLGVFDDGVFENSVGSNRNLAGTWTGGGPAVPEPATWAMMLAGFGGLGAAMRSRRRTVATTA